MPIKTPGSWRPGLPVESAWLFYPRFIAMSVAKVGRLVPEFWKLWRIYRRVAGDPSGQAYTDLALTPVAEDDVVNLELFTQNKAARDAVDHVRKVKVFDHGRGVAVDFDRLARFESDRSRSLNVGEEAADLAIEAFGLNRQGIGQ